MLQRLMAVVVVLCATGLASMSEAGRTSKHTGTTQTVAERPYSRFCKARDLVGTWRLVKFTSQFEFKDSHAPYLMPHQLFQFSTDGDMKSVYSLTPIQGDPTKALQSMPAVVTYGFGREGIVTVRAKGTIGASETWHCVTLTEDRRDEKQQMFMKRGDLIMTLVGKDGQAAFVRHLRKSTT
jgi:hypothetical protein